VEHGLEAPGCGQRAAARERCSACEPRPGRSGDRGASHQAARCPQATWRSPDLWLEAESRWIVRNGSRGSVRVARRTQVGPRGSARTRPGLVDLRARIKARGSELRGTSLELIEPVPRRLRVGAANRSLWIGADGSELVDRSRQIGTRGSELARAPEPTLHKTIGCHEVINDHAIVDPGAIPSTCDRAGIDRERLVRRTHPRPAEICPAG